MDNLPSDSKHIVINYNNHKETCSDLHHLIEALQKENDYLRQKLLETQALAEKYRKLSGLLGLIE